jgi:lactoylglutathione lyase
MQAWIPLLTVAALTAAHAAPAASRNEPVGVKLDNVRLLVTRFDESLAFYRDVLGLKLTWGKEGDNYASFAFANGGQIALFRRSLMADAVGTATRAATRTEQDTAALVFSVENVDEAVRRLEAAGVRFVSAPADKPAWGIRAAHFRDPDGNLIEIFSPIPRI